MSWNTKRMAQYHAQPAKAPQTLMMMTLARSIGPLAHSIQPVQSAAKAIEQSLSGVVGFMVFLRWLRRNAIMSATAVLHREMRHVKRGAFRNLFMLAPLRHGA